ncbi:HigA family addiction module antitoxin [Propioniciclava soli]|uniref:HigA family addiction module antitoxin n=1 Tax=Propioniciclava soli TaxID=2775081 RepID=A0ABZ3C6K5_9ACTN|nr:HigA family addiction module antitoxin [Propioniciclava soli]
MSSSSTTTDLMDPIHPGEILLEDFIEGFGMTENKLAVAMGVPPRRIMKIVHGKRGITADTAVRLRAVSTTAELWMNLQSHDELRLERHALRDQIGGLQPLRTA